MMDNQIVLRGRSAFPLTIAHRGARGHAPENTLAAARLAHAVGAHLWELDVNMTSDGKLVVMHDDTLARTTNVSTKPVFATRAPFRVCDFTLDELRTLDAGSWFVATDPFGRIKAEEVDAATRQTFCGEGIPTLEESLALTKKLNWRVNVEIKDHARLIGHEIVTQAVVELVRRMDMVEQVIISSFQHQYLLETRQLLPELATGALVETVRPNDPVALCRELGVDAYHPDRLILAEGDLERLRDAGFAVNVWTVNTVEEAERLVSHGASGIITDFPAACLAALGK